MKLFKKTVKEKQNPKLLTRILPNLKKTSAQAELTVSQGWFLLLRARVAISAACIKINFFMLFS